MRSDQYSSRTTSSGSGSQNAGLAFRGLKDYAHWYRLTESTSSLWDSLVICNFLHSGSIHADETARRNGLCSHRSPFYNCIPCLSLLSRAVRVSAQDQSCVPWRYQRRTGRFEDRVCDAGREFVEELRRLRAGVRVRVYWINQSVTERAAALRCHSTVSCAMVRPLLA